VAIGTLNVAVEHKTPPVVRVSGQADFHNRDQISHALDRLRRKGHATVRADLSALDYMDSSALATLIRCAQDAREDGGYVELTGTSRQVARVLTQCGAAVFFRSSVFDVPVDGEVEEKLPSENFWQVCDFRVPASPLAATIARQRVADVVRSLPFSLMEAADIIIAVGEAMANAIRHGCACDSTMNVSVKCVAGPSRLAVDITDPGDGFDPISVPVPSPKSIVDGGMGIYIMRQLMDEVSFFFDGATTARLIKYIAGP